MDINPDDYKGRVAGLSIGESIKVPHIGCSESKAMKITVRIDGTVYKCFKCGDYYFSSSFNSPRERLRRKAIFDSTMRTKADVSYDLPVDFSRTLPSEALAWVGQGGWTIEMIHKYNIGWGKELNRVILPVYPIGYIARSVHSWQNPKYLEKVPSGVMWESIADPIERPSTCVLCEDILSAGRCGEFMKAYSILGTSLDTSQLSEFIKYNTVYLWLDPDKGGLKGVQGIYYRLSLICNVIIIKSESDPKTLTDNEIRRYLDA